MWGWGWWRGGALGFGGKTATAASTAASMLCLQGRQRRGWPLMKESSIIVRIPEFQPLVSLGLAMTRIALPS